MTGHSAFVELLDNISLDMPLGDTQKQWTRMLVWTEATSNLNKKANVFVEPFLVTQHLYSDIFVVIGVI